MSKDMHIPPNQSDFENISIHDKEYTLECVLKIMNGISKWLIKSGIGYNEFNKLLKQCFYNAALSEIEELNIKNTDSSLSLLSGINRREISEIKKNKERNEDNTYSNHKSLTNITAKILTLWIQKKLPFALPITGENSFEDLVKEITTEKHHNSILIEMQRLGLLEKIGDFVYLQSSSFTPKPHLLETKKIFTDNMICHFSSGFSNMYYKKSFLEEAIYIENLSLESLNEVNNFNIKLWHKYKEEFLKYLMERNNFIESKNANEEKYSYKFGVYNFYKNAE